MHSKPDSFNGTQTNSRAESILPPASPKKETILVVDDDPSVREVMARVLGEEGYGVLTANDGPDALEIVEANRIDLVLLDLNMPLQSGWDTFEALAVQNPLVAVMVVTARPGQLFTALSAGVDAILEKPLDYSKLLVTVRSVLSEPAQARLERMAGRRSDFHYLAPDRKSLQS
jgi:DNA-binding response OmpR family regulator